MLIKSNFKDYYDFMVSTYGIDRKIVYNRVPEESNSREWEKTGMFKPQHIDFPDSLYSYTIHFCGTMYVIYYVYGDWFLGEGIQDANPGRYPVYIYTGTKKVGEVLKQWKSVYHKKRTYLSSVDDRHHGLPTKRNDELECPVVYDNHKNVRLSDFNFAKVIPPEDAFIQISNWLSREKLIINKQTDKEKIISHGFDTKTSFRKM